MSKLLDPDNNRIIAVIQVHENSNSFALSTFIMLYFVFRRRRFSLSKNGETKEKKETTIICIYKI